MLPKQELNIYSKSEENLNDLLSFYFDKHDIQRGNILEEIKNKSSLSLNQVEFIIRKLSESYKEIFETFLKISKNAAPILFNYGFEALTINEVRWNGSQYRLTKLKAFLNFVQKTEKDFNFLEKYN